MFGDGSVNISAQATDIPHVLSSYLTVGAATSTGIPLSFNGKLVTPAMNLPPSLLTPTMPQLGPGNLPGSIAGLAHAGDLTNADRSCFNVVASLIPQVLRQGGALAGNDTIRTGDKPWA